MRIIIFWSCLCLFVGMGAERVWGARALDDAEMNNITAGSLSIEAQNGQYRFSLGDDRSRMSVTGNATVAAQETAIPAGPVSYILLRDNAQSNLRAFVNVNAVNASVQVLINLTVNINSTIGTINQINTIRAF